MAEAHNHHFVPQRYLRSFAEGVGRQERVVAIDRIKYRCTGVRRAMCEKIEREIEALGADDLARFRRWFAECDAAQWDAQIEADALSGKLDTL